MGGIRVLFAALCLAGPLLLAAASPAHACTCGTIETSVDVFDLIVVGRVGVVRVVDELPPPEPGVTPAPNFDAVAVAFSFTVDEYIKGSGPPQLELQSRGHAFLNADGSTTIGRDLGPDCSFAPQDGGRYLFGVATDGGNMTGGCGSLLIDDESASYVDEVIADIRAALAGPEVLPNNGAGPPDDTSSAPSIALAAAVGSALAGAVLLSPLAWRRLRR